MHAAALVDRREHRPALFAGVADDVRDGRADAALVELDRWSDTLVLTYAEFGRRPKENLSAGTDHGTANVHFALGGRIAGGLYGEAPNLRELGGDGNPGYAIDFRAVYATVLEQWWNVDSRNALRGRFAPVPFLRT